MQSHINIRIGIKKPTIYEIGFITTDLFHLSLASKLYEMGEVEEIHRLYFKGHDYSNSQYHHPSRYDLADYYEKYHDDFQVSHLRLGSIEIGLAIASLTSSIVIPVALFVLDRRLKSKDQKIEINLTTQDPNINDFLQYLEQKGSEDLDHTFNIAREYLTLHNHEITSRGGDLYKVIDTTIKRTEKTLKTVYKIQRK